MTKKGQQMQRRTAPDVIVRPPPEIVRLMAEMAQANSEQSRRIVELEAQIAAHRGGDVGQAYNAGLERGAWIYSEIVETYLAPLWGAMTRAEAYMQQIKAAMLAGRGKLARERVGELVESLGHALAALDLAWSRTEPVLYLDLDREPIMAFYELARDYASGKTGEAPLLAHIAAMGDTEAQRVKRRAEHAPGARAFPARWYIGRRAIEVREASRGGHDQGRAVTWEQVARRMIDDLTDKMRVNRASAIEQEACRLLTTQGNPGDYVRSAVSDYRRRGAKT